MYRYSSHTIIIIVIAPFSIVLYTVSMEPYLDIRNTKKCQTKIDSPIRHRVQPHRQL